MTTKPFTNKVSCILTFYWVAALTRYQLYLAYIWNAVLGMSKIILQSKNNILQFILPVVSYFEKGQSIMASEG
jgi:hypothetical protein